MEKNKEEQVALNKQAIEALQRCYETMKNDIREIKDSLLKRPSWAVMFIITTLTTACSSLIVFIITR